MDCCDQCGFVYDTVARGDLPEALRALARRYDQVLAEAHDEALRAHPVADMWSALEYSCHVRDVFRVQRERVLLALAQDQPAFAPMRREERVVEERYNDQQPGLVAEEISDAAEALTHTLQALENGDWQRTGIYNWPESRVRTVEWIARHRSMRASITSWTSTGS